MKLVLVALALAAPSALAMAPYVPSTEYVEFAGDCVDGNGEFTFNANYQYENPSTPTPSGPGFGTYEDCKSRCDSLMEDCKAFAVDSTKPPEEACMWLWTGTVINPCPSEPCAGPGFDFESGNTNPIEGGDGNPTYTCYKKDGPIVAV